MWDTIVNSFLQHLFPSQLLWNLEKLGRPKFYKVIKAKTSPNHLAVKDFQQETISEQVNFLEFVICTFNLVHHNMPK